ncbi:copper amine oxidase N-terminal domain-containing protein [Bacillus sp. FJAT-45350]|uniref:copper amine oxidase N-terminal domain-containing protein n=1 Tax=Bacillus sp. FJAT-45350 TaxID=2011014 RepID=UPI001C53AC6D|nr:copper amine oxidase N-terminal domain-containing protein [Bacillus sp. FJAT-45350]
MNPFVGSFENGQAISLQVPAKVINGSTLVPVRFVSESLGAQVKWDSATRSVIVYEGSSTSLLNFEPYISVNDDLWVINYGIRPFENILSVTWGGYTAKTNVDLPTNRLENVGYSFNAQDFGMTQQKFNELSESQPPVTIGTTIGSQTVEMGTCDECRQQVEQEKQLQQEYADDFFRAIFYNQPDAVASYLAGGINPNITTESRSSWLHQESISPAILEASGGNVQKSQFYATTTDGITFSTNDLIGIVQLTSADTIQFATRDTVFIATGTTSGDTLTIRLTDLDSDTNSTKRSFPVSEEDFRFTAGYVLSSRDITGDIEK